MSLESACPCLGPPARLVRIRIGGSLGRCREPVTVARGMMRYYYVISSYARRSIAAQDGYDVGRIPLPRSGHGRPYGVGDLEVIERHLRMPPQGNPESLPVARVRRHESEEGGDDGVGGLNPVGGPRLIERDVGTAGSAESTEIEREE